MEHRLDTRLLQLPAASMHSLGLKLCAIDEFKGWSSREPQPGAVAESARQIVAVSLAALGRLEAFGAAEARTSAPRATRPPLSAAGAAYAETLEAVLCDHARMELGEDLLLELHARLLAHGRTGHGQYRTLADRASGGGRARSDAAGQAGMAAHLVPGETRDLLEWTRTRLAGSAFHPLLTTSICLFELIGIRPFESGNARLVRVLAHFLLLRCGYQQVARVSLDAALAAHWTECQVALRRSQASRRLPRPDLAPWLDACLDVMLEHAARARAAAAQSPDESRLSANQVGVLRLLDRDREITVRSVRERLGLPRDTAKQVLRRLVALGRIEPFGAGRAVRYRRRAGRRD